MGLSGLVSENITTEHRNLCALATTNRWLSDGCREGKYPFLCYFEAHYCDAHNVQIQDGFITDCREDGQFLHGDVVEVQCRKTYTLIGPHEITCLSNGTWSAMPTCEPGCLRPYDIPHSFPAVDKSWHRIGDTAIILCQYGYLVLIGSIPRSHAILTCTFSGVWIPEKLACIHMNSSEYSYSPEVVNKISVVVEGTTHLVCPEVTTATVEG
uniref:Sushi domain-containing protein n=1 Tax=Strigamia maritima TaxID=126957 RepID=T1IRE4_STRMM